MNVLHLVSNKVWGGGEQYVLDLCRRLDADGHSVAVITRGYDAVDEPFVKSGITPGHLPLGGVFDFISASRLSRVLDNISEPTVVHVHNFKDARTAVRARSMMRSHGKVKIVVTRHLVKAGKNDSMSKSLYGDLDAISFVSHTAMDAFTATCPTVDRNKLSVIYNAVADRTGVVADNKSSDELRLVYAGRLAAEKGIEKLIEAMPAMPQEAILHVIGSGKVNYELSLKRYAETIGASDHIVWHGHVSDPAPLMASADIGIVPTVTREAFGLTVVEFMQLGVPVIATNNGGPAEIITNGTDGILIAPSDSGAIVRAVEELAVDKEGRQSIGRAARHTVAERFNYETFYRNILNLYR